MYTVKGNSLQNLITPPHWALTTLTDTTVKNYDENMVHALNLTYDATLILIGNFSNTSLTGTAADISGTLFSYYIYFSDGRLSQKETWSEGTDWLLNVTDFSYELSRLSGDDIFEGIPLTGGNDRVQGMGGNDRFKGYDNRDEWGDQFYGGDGLDTSIYQGKISEYVVTASANASEEILDGRSNDGSRVSGFYIRDTVVDRDDNDVLIEIERLEFETPEANGANRIALDIDGNAGQAYRLYKAAFNRSPDTAGLGYWIANLDQGMSLRLVSTAFIGSAEFQALYGVDTSDSELIELLYNNVLSRDPDADGLDYWQGQLTGGLSHADLLVNFSESNENQENVIALIGNGIAYEQWMG